jgi:zinc protease
MKTPALALLLAGIPMLLFSTEAKPVRPEQLPPRPLLKVAPPALVRKTLPNGLRLIFYEDHTVPLIHVQALVKAGGIYDPSGKVGLAKLTAASLSACGTKSHPSAALHETLESLAADLSSSCDSEFTTITLDLLSKDLERGLPLFSSVVMQPAFESEMVEVERSKLLETLKRQNEDLLDAAKRELKKRLYGDRSEWARTPTLKGVQGITKEDLAAFHARYFKPGAAILAVSGDFSPEQMVKRIEGLFGAWPKEAVLYPSIAPVTDKTPPQVVIFDRPDLAQVEIFCGELTGRRFEGGKLNPDRYPLAVLSHMIGGAGFNSILMREIRSNRGLAYRVGSLYTFGTDRGVFGVYGDTGVESASQVVELMREVLAQAAKAPPQEKDIALIKDNLINQFAFEFDPTPKIVDKAATMEMQGFPEDYLTTYCDKLRAVAAVDLQETAKKYIHPASQTLVVIGPAKSLQEPLAKFGTVVVEPLPEP